MKPWLLLPALTGGALWLCFYPVGWGFLAWVALVPLSLMVDLDARPWKIYLGAFLGGCLFYWPILSWMTVADYRMVYTWAMLATYFALYFPVALFLIRRLAGATRWPLSVTVPLVWTGLEYFRSFFGTGFAWYFLGHSQHHYLPVIQMADLAGVYAISFLMAAVNGWIADFLLALPRVRHLIPQAVVRPPLTRRSGFAILTLVAAMLAYGGWRLSQDRFAPGPRVALLQGSLDQRILNDATSPTQKKIQNARDITQYYSRMCDTAVQVFLPPPDLLIWPETSFPYPWLELPSDLNNIAPDVREEARLVQALVRKIASTSKVHQLIGLNFRVVGDGNKEVPYNSALLLTGEGAVTG